MSTPTPRITAYQKVQLLTDNTTSKSWLKHLSSYLPNSTLESTARIFFESLLADPIYKAKAKKLGLIK